MNILNNIRNAARKKLAALIYFILIFAFLELSLHLLFYPELTARLVYPLLFGFVAGSILYFICALFPNRLADVLACILISLAVIYFEVQLVYHCIFGSFMPLSQITMGTGAVTSFFSQMVHAVYSNIIKVLVIFIPIPLTLFLVIKKYLTVKRLRLVQIPLAALICVILSFTVLGTLHLTNDSTASAYAILVGTNTSTETSVKTVGLCATTVQEFKGMLNHADTPDSFAETSLIRLDGQKGELNATDISFGDVDGELGNYLSKVSPTAKNEYTGIAKDYNLITVCAEAFSPLLIDPELTPTLYMLSNNGIVFENFYNCFPNTTTNGEYCFNTGLMPDMSRDKLDNSFNSSVDNYMPLCLGNIYSEMGYRALAYHNYYGTFYDRHITHKNMGYDFKAALSGLDIQIGNPSSDLDMIEASMPDYINGDEPFHVYYMTYSGHYQYNWENQMSAKNRDKVEHLPYSEEVKAYIACNLELEYALQALMKGLEESGKADNTVIVLTGDHYPYGLNIRQYSELAGKDVDPYFEKYRNSFICYIPGIETVRVKAPCSTPDILPTILNIMGIEFDSRLLAGRDVMSNAPHVAVLADRSFITESFRYNASTAEVTADADVTVSDAELTDYRNYVDNIFTLSAAILNTDCYAAVYGHTKTEDKSAVMNYEDITNNNVYIESTVTFMVNEGFMEPKSETEFGVNDPGTVRELVETLYRMKAPEGYDDALKWALSLGIITPEQPIDEAATYADTAKVIFQYCCFGMGPDVSALAKNYPDLTIDEVAALSFCYNEKLIMGDVYHSSFELAHTTVTRYQIAAFLQRMYMYNLI
ncbi:MAG: sulfatase-like hydrolase/transferase [Clostridia bacterium]|nr:sulfatase-like hydrolase/transferase [Clostridia bacterium]